MIRRFLLYRFLQVCLFTVLSASFALGQTTLTCYHMYGIPQSNLLNPAFQPECNFYIGMPMLSPLRFSTGLNSLQYKDIFTWDNSIGQFITFMHPNGDKDAFLKALKPVNNLNIALSTNFISMGWKKENLFFSLDLTERIENNLSIPGDFFQFLVYLSRDQDQFNFSDFGDRFLWFREFAFGMSYKTDEEIQVGGKVKALFGIANATVRPNLFNLETSIDMWDIQSQVNVDMSMPYLITYTSPEGKLDSLDFEENIDEKKILSDIPTILGTGNLGFGIDLGVSYPVIENLTVSASLTDLGFIRWRRNIHNLKQNGQFSFEGVELDLLSQGEDEENSSMVDDMLDSLKNQMDFFVTENPYTTNLSGALNLGAAYELNKMVRFGLATRTRVYNARFYNQLTLSANVQPIRAFSASVSYSVIGNNYANLGVGLSLKAGPFNIYFITDQAASAYLSPANLQSVNFWLGMNMIYGCPRKKAKTPDDLPLID